ncbi:MAG TPA: Spy/CpxP family protein refolding chaperone, partial [Gemmatimonadaceae bacterium]|nr:Spy/CpxP family protein refolding chaperone [Gemmatimonadaceae bacterium]
TMLALVIVAGAAATAGAQQPAPQNGQRIERSQGDSVKRGMRKGHGAHGKMRAGRALLRGVDLTDAQKAQVKEIHQKYESQFQSIEQANKPAMDEARAARQRGDTTAARAAFAKTSGAREQLEALRKQEASEIRGILTAEQQKTFDANLQQAQARQGEHGKRGGRRAR